MNPQIAVVDYGMGNLRSVQKALESVGAAVTVTDSPSHLREAQAVVLPGVGAFGEAVHRLQRRRLWDTLERTLADGKPFLGICLGLQLLFDRSDESPRTRGLGFLKGSVKRFRGAARRIKVPHIGWNRVALRAENRSPWLKPFKSDRYFYFVHSYFPIPAERRWIAGTTTYGARFCSMVAGPSLLACQFHPEKSGTEGLKLLHDFVQRVGGAAC